MPNFSKIGDGWQKKCRKGCELTWNVPKYIKIVLQKARCVIGLKFRNFCCISRQTASTKFSLVIVTSQMFPTEEEL